jgi:hypothetical protein
MLSRWKERADMDWEDVPRPRAASRSSELFGYVLLDADNSSDPSSGSVADSAKANRVAGYRSDVEGEPPDQDFADSSRSTRAMS